LNECLWTMFMKKVFTLFCFICLLIAGCNPAYADTPEEEKAEKIEGARKEGSLMYYTAMGIADSTALVKRFQEKYPFIKTDMFRAGGEKLLVRLLTEARAGRYIPDVIQLSDFRSYAVKKEGLLLKYSSPESKAYPEVFKDPDGYVTIYFNSNVIGYNTRLVTAREAPKDYQDLLQPQWRGKLGMDVSDIKWFTGQLKIMGEEKGANYMRKLASQKPRNVVGNTLTSNLLSAGEFPVAVNVYPHQVEEMKRVGAPIEWVPVPPVLATPQMIGVSSHARHPNAGKLFVDFALSREGQELIQSFNRLSAREGIISKPPRLTAGIKFYVLDTKLADSMDRDQKLFREIFLNK